MTLRTALAALAVWAAVSACGGERQLPGGTGGDRKPWSCSVAGFDSIDHFTLTSDGATVNFLAKQGGGWRFVYSSGLRLRSSERGRIERERGLDTARTLAVSPDGSRAGVVFRRASRWRDRGPAPDRDDSAGQWFVMIDRHVFGGFDGDFRPTVHFSPDGSKFGFPYQRLGQCYVQVVDTTFGPYDRADMTITTEGEIVLGYIRQDRAYIEKIYSPGQRE